MSNRTLKMRGGACVTQFLQDNEGAVVNKIHEPTFFKWEGGAFWVRLGYDAGWTSRPGAILYDHNLFFVPSLDDPEPTPEQPKSETPDDEIELSEDLKAAATLGLYSYGERVTFARAILRQARQIARDEMDLHIRDMHRPVES